MNSLKPEVLAFLTAFDTYGKEKGSQIRNTLTCHLTPLGLVSLAGRFHEPRCGHPVGLFDKIIRMKNPLPMFCLQPGYLKDDASALAFIAELKEAHDETIERRHAPAFLWNGPEWP